MKGYTRKVGLRKPDIDLTCADCWIRNETCTHPELAQAEIEAQRRHKAHGSRPDPLCPCNWSGEPGERKVRPSDGLVETIQQAMPTTADMRAEYEGNWAVDWLRDQVRRSAATLDGLPPEMRETLAHRTRGRVVKPVPVVASDEFARNWDAPLPPDDLPLSCPHCPCTQTTECCYCDGTRTPLEDS